MSSSRGTESLEVDRGGVVAEVDEQVGSSLDEGRRPADEDPWALRRCRADMAEHVGVDPAREAGPAGGRLARECLMYGEPVAGGEPWQLVAVQDVVAGPRGQQQPRVHGARVRRTVAQH